MITKFSGDLDTIMRYLWDDERVDFILQQVWNELLTMVAANQDEVSEAIHNFCHLLDASTSSDVIRFLDTLDDDIMDCLLVELARELHFIKQHEGEVLH